MPAPPCSPDCQCGKHSRTPQHNARIGIAVALTAEAKGRSQHPETLRRNRYRR